MTVKEGTYGIPFYFRLLDQNGNAIDVDDVDTVIVKTKLGATLAEHECENVDTNLWFYVVEEGDLYTSGVMKLEPEVDMKDGAHINATTLKLTIQEALK